WAMPGVSTISSAAPSRGVPSAQRSKQKRIVSGNKVEMRPTSKTTRVTRAPLTRARTASTTSWVTPSSCIRTVPSDDLPRHRLDDLDGLIDGGTHRGREADLPKSLGSERRRLATYNE